MFNTLLTPTINSWHHLNTVKIQFNPYSALKPYGAASHKLIMNKGT